MMGPRQEAQAALFQEFSLEGHFPQNHLLRSIDRFVDLDVFRSHLADFYSHTRVVLQSFLLAEEITAGLRFKRGLLQQNRKLNPSIGQVRLLMKRWSCSTTLFRNFRLNAVRFLSVSRWAKKPLFRLNNSVHLLFIFQLIKFHLSTPYYLTGIEKRWFTETTDGQGVIRVKDWK